MFKAVLIPTIILLITFFAYINYPQEEITYEEVQSPILTKSPPSDISIEYLRTLNVDSEAPQIVEELTPGSNYKRYIASYISEGNIIYGLLTVPLEAPPEDGYSAIVFNHGYIPPNQYVTTEKYVAYVDALARAGFVVFKIDMRGNGNSEGNATGSYFSSGYTLDAISALKSLQKLDYIDSTRIGMWGHSMAGNLVLRAMLVEDEVKAGVIWAGAVYSYEDFAEYRLNDTSYVPRVPLADDPHYDANKLNLRNSEQVRSLRESPEDIDFNDDFWSSISLTKNIDLLKAPLQIHHAINDPTVNIGYTRDLDEVLKKSDKNYEVYEYEGGRS